MKKIGDLLKELGFEKEGTRATQEAFVKHLVRAADQASPALKFHSNKIADFKVENSNAPTYPISNHGKRTPKEVDAQLSFDFEDQRTSSPKQTKSKQSNSKVS